MRIENHRLVGPGIRFVASPNRGGALAPRFLVMHYTAAPSADNAVRSLCDPQRKASAHVVLGRDGSIVQLVPFNVVAWHAGVSQWNGLVGMNNHSIGIEIDNMGQLKKVGNEYQAWFGRSVPADQVVLAAHKHGGGVQAWHAYSKLQIERALELADLLVSTYGLEDVIGHEDIARGRKTDPGPAFPLEAVKGRAIGRQADEAPVYRVVAPSLNIRGGPGAQFEPVAPPLRQGTRVHLLEPGDRFSRVEVIDRPDVEGWVSNSFITADTGAGRAAPQRAGRAAATRGARKTAGPAAKQSPRKTARKAGATAARKAAAKAPARRPAAKAAKTAAKKVAKKAARKPRR